MEDVKYYNVVEITYCRSELSPIYASIKESDWTALYRFGDARVRKNGKTYVFRGFQQMSITVIVVPII